MLKYPKTCVWELTMGCNMRCGHCGSVCENPLPDELTAEEAYKFIDMCSDIGLEWISLSGGEPLIRKDLPLLLKYLESKNIFINIITNGWLIDDELIEIFKNLKGIMIAISIDGTKEIHDNIRKKGSFERAMNAFKKLKENGVNIGCITTISNQNINCLSELKKVLKDLKIDCWQVQMGLPMGSMSKHLDWIIKPEQLSDIIDFCHENSFDQGEERLYLYPADCIGYYTSKEEEMYKNIYGNDTLVRWSGCNAGVNSFGMLHNGDIVGCTSMRGSEFIEGNIKKRTLREIWEDPNAFKWRRNFKKEKLTGDCKKCKHAEECLGGCTNTRLTLNGNINSENIYCIQNLLMKK